MNFVDLKYETNAGSVFFIRLTEAYAAVAGAPPSGAALESFHVEVKKNRREFGLHPRTVSLSTVVGEAPNTFKKFAELPILTPAVFDGLAIGNPITLNGVVYNVSSKNPERLV